MGRHYLLEGKGGFAERIRLRVRGGGRHPVEKKRPR
jgi:hypothetical protein